MRTFPLVLPTSVLLCSLLSFGCAAGSRSQAGAKSAQSLDTLVAVAPGGTRQEQLAALAASELRKPGDYVVHRFSGSFRKAPLRLTQTVIAVDGGRTTVDMALGIERSKSKGPTTVDESMRIRVVFDRTPGATREVAQVTRLLGDREEPGTIEDYEKLMAETVVVPDRNDDIIGTEVVSTNVGERSVDCTKTSYRIAIGKKTGVMSTLSSNGFAWGDVGGEIKTDDGKLLYKAEVIDSGDQASAKASASR